MKYQNTLLILLLTSIFWGGAQAQTFTSSGGSVPNYSVTCFSQSVFTGNKMMDSNWGLTRVCLNGVTLGSGGDWATDFNIYLRSPSGVAYYLTAGHGPSASFNGTICFDMSAATPITSWSATTGSIQHQPFGPFGLFNNGQTSQGYWEICFDDTYLFGSGASLTSWSLTFGNNPTGNPILLHGQCGGNMDVCSNSPITYYDDNGGTGGAYSYGTTDRFCPTSSGQCVRATINSYDLETGYDYLDFYDGPSTGSPFIGFLNGTGTGPINVTSTTGCLTLDFNPDGSVFWQGWDITFSCVPCGGGSPPATPANDSCGGAIPLSGNGSNALGNGCDLDAPNPHGSGCGWLSTENSVFYTVTVTPSTTQPVTITINSVSCTGGGGNLQTALYSNCDSLGYYGNNFFGCATGSGTVTLNAGTLKPGTYILAIDGDAGAACTWNVTSPTLDVRYFDFTGEFDPFTTWVNLDWSTTYETGNQGFFIERSPDHQNWKELDFVASPNTNSSSKQAYRYIDKDQLTAGKYFYRLRQLDMDGSSTYSQMVEINVTEKQNEGIIAQYPNPVTDHLNIQLNVKEAGEGTFELMNTEGKLLSQMSLGQLERGGNYLEIDLEDLAPGLYFWRIRSSGGKSWSGKLLAD